MDDVVLMPIGPAAKAGDMQPGTLRTYDRENLLKPLRDAAGNRLYTPAMVAKAIEIKAAREARMFRRKP
jgi:DNA-binding transcriptional MerR regulator